MSAKGRERREWAQKCSLPLFFSLAKKTMFRMAFHGKYGNVWNALMSVPEVSRQNNKGPSRYDVRIRGEGVMEKQTL